MISAKKAAANGKNALLSTGPHTPAGKAVACQNARTHGLLSRQVLLPDENRARLIALREHFLAELAPVGELETLLVERIIACAWRLRRLHRVEAEVFEHERRDFEGADEGLGRAFLKASSGGGDTFSKLTRYEAALERAFYRALHERRASLIADLGGDEAVSTQQLALVDLAVRTKLLADSVDVYVLAMHSPVNRQRALPPSRGAGA